jgi:hypothetical protein
VKGLSEDQQDSGECSPRRDVHSQQFMKLCASALAPSVLRHTHMTHVIIVASDLMQCCVVAVLQSHLRSFLLLQGVHVAKAYRALECNLAPDLHSTFALLLS